MKIGSLLYFIFCGILIRQMIKYPDVYKEDGWWSLIPIFLMIVVGPSIFIYFRQKHSTHQER